MNRKIIFKFTDKSIYFYENNSNKMIIEEIKDDKVIENCKIKDVEKLLSILEEKISNHKLSSLLIKTQIFILIPSFYNKTDNFLLTYIFKSLNYYNYKFIEERTLYKNLLEEGTAVINIWDNLGEISYLEKNKIISIPYNEEQLINLKEQNIIIINNTSYKKINIPNKKIYYIEPKKYYLIEELKKIINL